MKTITRLFLSASVAVLAPLYAASAADIKRETLVDGLEHPWAVAELPDGGYVITERGGAMIRTDAAGNKQKISGVPDVYARSQGGLLDLVLDPDFANNQTIWFSYAKGDRGANATALAKAVLDGNALKDVTLVFESADKKDTPVHYGARIAFLPDGTVLIPTGDGFDYREQAQNGASHMGKVIRLNKDGSVPDDNPFVGEADWKPEIWTLGHRNPQGLVYDPIRDAVILHEHGPKGGDEINILEKGANYGWPIATHGVDYSGAKISPYTSYKDMVDGIHIWTPSIAPSGLAVYRGTMFAEWDGDLLVGALAKRALYRVDMDGLTVKGEERLLDDLGARIRDVRVASDGAILVLVDAADGQLLRLTPQ